MSFFVSLCLCGLIVTPTAAQRPPDLTRDLSAALGAQGRVMWVDGSANLVRKVKVNGVETLADYTTTREGVADIVRRCKQARINTLVVDIKPISGQVLYNSKIAPRMKEWKGRRVPDFDVLAAFVEEGHKAGLSVHAAINTLSEGHKYFSVGPAYEHPEWQSVVYTVDRGLLAPDGSRLPVRATGEPDDLAKPTILTDAHTILGEEPVSGLVGLESTEKGGAIVSGTGAPLGKQLNLALDADNRVIGMVDNGLLGDDPLVSPGDGHLLTVTRPADRAWISQHLKAGTVARFDLRTARTPIAQAPSEKVACFINPLHPEARRRILDIIREIVSNYAIDGFVLDRCRYSNLYNDFSDRSRDAFAQWLQAQPRTANLPAATRWPEDVFAFAPIPGDPLVAGPLYKPWLEFRAQVIRDFVSEVARLVRGLKPNITFGTYVGSWYPSYYEVGVNWGSERTHLRYPWFTPDYPRTGYVEFFDWIATGCYYPTATREDARRQGLSEKATVEYAAELSRLAVANGAFVYPGLYVPDYAGKPEAFLRALNAAGRQGQGWMIFDLTYIEEYGWWSLLERASDKDASPPHLLSDLLPAARAALDAAQ